MLDIQIQNKYLSETRLLAGCYSDILRQFGEELSVATKLDRRVETGSCLIGCSNSPGVEEFFPILVFPTLFQREIFMEREKQ